LPPRQAITATRWYSARACDWSCRRCPAGVIAAARDVQLSGTNLTNKGALITGGRNVTVGMAGAIDNTSIPLNADWVGRPGLQSFVLTLTK
jgi:adhesin HecA-like repeat protein